MTSVRDVMSEKPVAAVVPSARREVLKLFLKHGYSGFPVLKQDSRKLVGVVTRQDLLAQPDEDQLALLMNPNPLTTGPQEHVRDAARIIRDAQTRTLPVVSGNNDLVGVVTPADLLEVLRSQRGPIGPHLRNRFVPCSAATPASVAFEVIRRTRASALPILDDEGVLCGILTDGDLLSHAEVTDTIVRTITGIGGDSDEWTWEGLRDLRRLEHAQTRIDLPKTPVSKFMIRDVVTVTPHTTVAESAERMLTGHFSQLPVVDGENHVLDVLSDYDLTGALLT